MDKKTEDYFVRYHSGISFTITGTFQLVDAEELGTLPSITMEDDRVVLLDPRAKVYRDATQVYP